jgi:hypothetical protein
VEIAAIKREDGVVLGIRKRRGRREAKLSSSWDRVVGNFRGGFGARSARKNGSKKGRVRQIIRVSN